jgi:hypothetical protein
MSRGNAGDPRSTREKLKQNEDLRRIEDSVDQSDNIMYWYT